MTFHVRVLDAPPANAAGLELLCVSLDFRLNLGAPDFAVLSDEERMRAARFLRHEDAIRFAATRAVLRHALAGRTGVPADKIQFERDAAGRPRLATRDPWHMALDFNVSHSGDYALIALAAGRRVGVDIEAHRGDVNWRTLAPSVLAPHDAACIARLPEPLQAAAFYDVWTAKEALLKAPGVGIGEGMTWFSVLGGKPDEPVVRVCNRKMQTSCALTAFDSRWCIGPVGYSVCMAWSRALARQCGC